MQSWWAIAPQYAALVGFMVVPGAFLAWSWGARAAGVLGFSLPAVMFALLLLTLMTPAVPLQPWTLLLVVAVLSALGWAVRWGAGRVSKRAGDDGPPAAPAPSGEESARSRFHQRALWSPALLPWIGLAMASVVAHRVMSFLMVAPDALSQTFDNAYHQNSARLILDTGVAAPWSAAQFFPGDAGSYYPSLWHALVALTSQLTGLDVPVATNLAVLLVAGFAWPSGMMMLTAKVMGRRPLFIALGTVASVGFPAFPYHLVVYGVLYPSFLAVALLPAAVVAGWSVLLPRGGATPSATGAGGLGLLLISAGAVSGAHPNMVFAYLVMVLPLAAVASFPWVASWVRTGAVLKTALFAVAAATAVWAVAWLWGELAPTYQWKPREKPAQAAGEWVFSGTNGLYVPLLLAVLAVWGMIHLGRSTEHRWLVVSFLLTGFLYVVAASWADGDFRDALTSLWYNDSHRLGALQPLWGAVFATVGLWRLSRKAPRWIRLPRTPVPEPVPEATARRRPARATVLAGAALALAPVLAYYPGVYEFQAATTTYDPRTPGRLLSTRAADFLKEVGRIVPEGERIANSPADGSAFLYALTGRQVLFNYFNEAAKPGADRGFVLANLRDAATDPKVCQALERLDARYALVMEPNGTSSLTQSGVSESADLRGAPGFTVVASSGNNSLYRIDACAR